MKAFERGPRPCLLAGIKFLPAIDTAGQRRGE